MSFKKNLNNFLIIFLLLFYGCSPSPQLYIRSSMEGIDFIKLYNFQKKSVGHAIRLEKQLYLSPDHLLEKNDKKLFYKNKSGNFLPIKVKMRDFSHDLVFFETHERPDHDIFPIIFPQKNIENFNVKKQELFYKKNSEQKSIYAGKKTGEIRIEYLLLNNLLEISEIFDMGDSGLPFWDKAGNFRGILIASDTKKNLSYILPASQIFDLYKNGYLYSIEK